MRLRALLAVPALLLPVLALPALGDEVAPCVPRRNVTVVPVGGGSATIATPPTPVVGSAQGEDTAKRFVLDLGDAAAAPVDVALRWATVGADFDVAVVDRFGAEELGRGATRNAVAQTTAEEVPLPVLAHCTEFVVRASNVAGTPSEVLTVDVAVGTPLEEVPTPSAPLPRTGWTASGSPGQQLQAPGDVPANVLDGKADTRWSTGRNMVPGDFVALDLGAPTTFSRLVVDAGTSTADAPVGWLVQVSDDGLVWRDVATGTGRARTTARFATQTVQHVRVVQTGTTVPNNINYWSVAELDLFADR